LVIKKAVSNASDFIWFNYPREREAFCNALTMRENSKSKSLSF